MVGVEEAADVVFGEAVLSPEEVVEVQVELLWGGRQPACWRSSCCRARLGRP